MNKFSTQPWSPLALAMALAWSAQASAAGLALEEVVVTAQKREESLQSTPISLSVLDPVALETKGINSITDLQANVPNLQITPHPNSASTARIFLRGIGNNDDQITQDPSVAVYIDGVYVARSQGLAMDVADIQRIEVLRGPQGTLYGRNATGGAINYVTTEPVLEQFGIKQQFTVGNRDLFRSKTMVNIPLGENFAARVAYLTSKEDGYVDNLGTSVSRFGDRDREAYRADLLWQASDVLSVRYNYDQSNIDDTPTFFARAPYHPGKAKRPSKSSPLVSNLRANDVTSEGHSLTVNWEIADNLSLKSITAYRELENFQNQNFLAGTISPTTGPVFANAGDRNQEQWSQEFQLLGDALDQRLEYIVGAYYFKEEGDSDGTTASLGRPTTFSGGDFENSAYALFGQATYTPPVLEDRLHITVGLRYSEDEREATRANGTMVNVAPPNQPPVLVRVPDPIPRGKTDFDDVSPSLVIAYDVTDEVNVYAKAVKGYKTGGFNLRASSAETFSQGFDEETLMSYELGLKSQWLENRVRVNAAVFQADYEDIQVNVQSDPTNPRLTDVLNAGDATVRGMELDITAVLLEGLTLNLNYGYLDNEYNEIKDARGVNLASDFRFVSAPQHSYTADLTYDFPALPFGLLSANVGYVWQDENFSSTRRSEGNFIIDDYGLLNARLTLSAIPMPAGELRVALWGKNLEDKEYYVAFFNVGTGIAAAAFGDPRSYGLDVIYEY